MKRFAFIVVIVVGVGCMAFYTADAQSAEPKRGLSKSTIIYLADPKDPHDLEKDKNEQVLYSYVPAGTWVKTLEKTWKDRVLVQTENGIFGYIPKSLLWDENNLAEFTQLGKVAFFRQNYFFQKKGIISLWFTRSEYYPVVSEDDENEMITLKVDITQKIVEEGTPPITLIKTKDKLPAIFEANVKKDAVKIINFKEKLIKEEIKFRLFDRHIADGIIGVQKPCGTKKSIAIKTSVGGGLKLSKFFLNFGAEASRETENIETFDEEMNVKRTYYIEKGKNAKYRLDQRKDCKTKEDSFYFLKINEGSEVIITKDWAERVGLPVEASEGRVRLTCPREYFKFDKALENELDPSERAFLITKVARFKKRFRKCDSQEP